MRARRRNLMAAACMALMSVSSCAGRQDIRPGDQWAAGTREHTVSVGDARRTYLLKVPAARRRNRVGVPVGFPIIIMLHGSGADGETVRHQSSMDRYADSLRFLVAYPNGSSRLFGLASDWNAGKCCGEASRANVDDVGFLTTLINDVAKHVPVDRRRIYVAGFSDGGRMAFRFACAASPIVAAAGVVSGSLEDDACHPARPVPLIAFHGTADTEVAYSDSSVNYWAQLDGCSRSIERRAAPHVIRRQFAPCSGADVVFYRIDGGQHAWPGGLRDGGSGAPPTTEINATAEMVRFFLRRRR